MDPRDDSVKFGAFDPDAEVWISQRALPHWFQPGVAIFVTFRTGDSMPAEVVRRWHDEQAEWLLRHGIRVADDASLSVDAVPEPLRAEFRKLRDRCWHWHLDSCHGECVLRKPDCARIVADTLLHFEGDRYDLDSFVVMPNHVHVLVQFRTPTTLKIQSKSWLHYSAREINALLGRRGALWQSEPFDHLVRGPEQFKYLQRYNFENPRKAGLREGEYLYWNRETRALIGAAPTAQ